MASRKLYAVVGIVCGFVLIDYGFNFLAIGLPEAGALTSQFVGGTLAAGGSAVVFLALYSLLSPAAVPTTAQVPEGPAPDVSAETIVEEETGSQYGFYKHIEYVGYLFTALGLFSLADLILQVFVHQLYNETRWWVEVLLVTFGMLSYAIFGSVGRIGAQEEREMASHVQPTIDTATQPASEVPVGSADIIQIPSMIDVHLTDFVKSSSGDLEHHLAGHVYDMMRIHPEMVTIWREDRQEIRAIYLVGPYEFTKELLEEQLKRGEELKVGSVSLTIDVIHELLKPQSASVSA